MSDELEGTALAGILICEDGIMLARDKVRALGKLGCGVVSRTFSGEEAIGVSEENNPDLVQAVEAALRNETHVSPYVNEERSS